MRVRGEEFPARGGALFAFSDEQPEQARILAGQLRRANQILQILLLAHVPGMHGEKDFRTNGVRAAETSVADGGRDRRRVAPIGNEMEFFGRDTTFAQAVDKALTEANYGKSLGAGESLERTREAHERAVFDDTGGKSGVGSEVGDLHDERCALQERK